MISKATNLSSRVAHLCFALVVAALALPAVADAQGSPPPYALSSPILPLILQMPENSWVRVNTNRFVDVWTPDELEPLSITRSPYSIIEAWSGFAWDTNRGDIILYGGGHANYSGNDVYRWRSSTLHGSARRCRATSTRTRSPGFQAIDGVDNAPSSAHTYDNNIFLPVADRFLTWGGAA